MRKLFVAVGTRPEAIKLAPVILALRARGHCLCVGTTGQHADLADEALGWFGIKADCSLGGRPGELDATLSSVLNGVGAALDREQAGMVLVQGDTLSAFAGALAAYHRRIQIGHVEAGLRSGDLSAPWPEEGYRKLITGIADLHFAPTASAVSALQSENVPSDRIHLCGNTAIDALRLVLGSTPPQRPKAGAKKLVVVTCHRRESLGAGLQHLVRALQLLSRRRDIGIVVMLHPNPRIRSALAGLEGVRTLEPLPYPAFIELLSKAYLIMTDSGGVQEEAPTLGVPVLILRDVTERIESVVEGTAKLVGTQADRIVAEAKRVLDNPLLHARMSRRHNAYGNGRAAERIAEVLDVQLRDDGTGVQARVAASGVGGHCA